MIFHMILAWGVLAIVSCQAQIVKQSPDFNVEVVAEDLRVPWSIVFLPDGRMLFTERIGRVRIIEDGVLQKKAVLTIEVLIGRYIFLKILANGIVLIAY